MFIGEYKMLQEITQQLQAAANKAAFEHALKELRDFLKNMGVSKETLLELERRAYYPINNYSDKDTREKMRGAKDRVLAYVAGLREKETKETPLLLNILENFYFFLEALLEREPHKKGKIQKEQLEGLQIANEYDVQHLLYAYLKPLYPEARAEVSEDTGYHLVRVDIALNPDCVIEVKCTRKGLGVNKLLEEIETDMVHYSAKEIYFFIYDKEKMIENPIAFKNSNEAKMKDKQIHIIIHQPKVL